MKMKFPSLWAAVGLSMAAVPALQADQMADANNPADKTYSGTVSSVDNQAHTLTTRSMLFNKHFHMGDSCAYVLPNSAMGSLSNLRPGEKVQISYQNSQGVLVADRVEIVPLRYDGTVQAIDPVNHTLTIKENGSNRNLALANGCRVVLWTSQAGTLNSIQPGDRVTVDYETPGDQATAWQISQTSKNLTGSVMAMDLTDRTVKVKDGLTVRSFKLADNCTVVLNGQPEGRLQDLRTDERVVLTYNEANGVNVVNRIVPVPVVPANPSLSGVPGMGY